MTRPDSFLNNIDVAAPCDANWNDMTGDEQIRHCQLCKLNVYNLSEMTQDEAEQLILEKEGNLCVKFYRRPDGTMLTKNCPVGLAAIQQRVAKVAAIVFTAILSVTAFMDSADAKEKVTNAPCAVPQSEQVEIMGDIAYPIMGEMVAPDETPPAVQPTNTAPPESTWVEQLGRLLPQKPSRTQGLMGKPIANPTPPPEVEKN